MHWIDNVVTALQTSVGSVPAVAATSVVEEKSLPEKSIIKEQLLQTLI
ncbi:hypothetical protein [Niabella ginsengisoli]|uniref:Uncharacterized protein n=1 Tax=Niabella ginsengisoli TaxID=522298 RepID=A0ABS9SPX4_9BACT|nr:hypothetical protein [Niabella ginsengisoli]MCH5600420.1 hypothetical protein [Niabella ginsengisoli]